MKKLLLVAISLIFFTNLVIAESDESPNEFVNALIKYLNSKQDNEYDFQDGILVSSNRKADYVYDIEANLKAVPLNDKNKFKLLKCHGRVRVDGEAAQVEDDSSGCEEEEPHTPSYLESDQSSFEDVSESTPISEQEVHVSLANEVQSNTQATSGEQFVAVRRDDPGNPCSSGCSSFVDVNAAGVSELATLAIRHIDRHEPTEKHQINQVISVERQVQVVNGVRYILLLNVDYDRCTNTPIDSCIETKTCKVSILEKPWVHLPDGTKFRAIISNNCTAEYLFGDNGEVLPSISEGYEDITDPTTGERVIQKFVQVDTQATKRKADRELSSEELKELEKQIIPKNFFEENETFENTAIPVNLDESTYINNEIFEEPLTEKTITKEMANINLSEDQKNALKGFDDFFNSRPETLQVTRTKRSLLGNEYDLQLSHLLINTLNKYEFENKKRSFVNLLETDRESVNGKTIQYVKVSANILECAKNEDVDNCQHVKRKYEVECGGMVDVTNKGEERVLKAACSPKQANRIGKKIEGNSNDQNFIDQAFNKIKSEYKTLDDMKLNLVVKDYGDDGSIRVKLEISYLTCPKNSPSPCSSPVSSTMICEANGIESNSLELSYSCKDILPNNPAALTGGLNPWLLKGNDIDVECTTNAKNSIKTKRSIIPGGQQQADVNDPKIVDLAHASMLHYEKLTNAPNAHKIVQIGSASTQVVAGLMTRIQFDLIETECMLSEQLLDRNKCAPKNVPPKKCSSSIWDRPWLENGREITVKCVENESNRLKRDMITGGVQGTDVNDPEIINLAHASMQHYEKLTSAPNAHKIVQINSASTQVVAGLMTRIQFDLIETECLLSEQLLDRNACAAKNVPPKKCSSSVWDRPWLENGREITVKCLENESNRLKRDMLAGGVQETDVNDPEIINLAHASMQHYEKLTSASNAHKIVQINSASTQVVAGSLTRIQFDLIETECLLSEQLVDRNACAAKNVPPKKCSSSVWDRPWLENGREITVKCVENESNRLKRDMLAGGVQETDVNDPEIINLAHASMQHYEKLTSASNAHKIVQINSASTQVVAGLMTRIQFDLIETECLLSEQLLDRNACAAKNVPPKKCSSSVWDRPWLENGREITVKCVENESNRLKRDMLTGGVQETDVNDPEIINLAHASMQHYEKLTSAPNAHKIVQINSASTQVVAGLMTRIQFDLIETECLLSEQLLDRNACAAKNVPPKKCSSSVWDRPWLENGREITVKCVENESTRLKRDMLAGGVQETDVNDPEIINLAHASMQHYEKLTSASNAHKIVQINSASTQVVAGSLTRIQFDLIETECLLSEQLLDRNACAAKNVPPKKCSSSVWDRPWLENGREITVKCLENESNRLKRDMLAGGVQETDVNDPEIINLAHASMQHYEKLTSASNAHKIVQINSASTQVVAGSLTRIQFDLIETECLLSEQLLNRNACAAKNVPPKKCSSSVWDRPWLENGREITVKCLENESNRLKRDMLAGGVQETDVNDPEIINLAHASMQHYEKLTSALNAHKIVQINSASTQVVAGLMTRIQFDLIETECLLSEQLLDRNACAAKNVPPKKCSSSVWDRPWLENGREITVKCVENESNRLKRDMLAGGVQETDVNDPEIINLAHASMQHYEKLTSASNAHKIVQINSASTQVVAGSLTRIQFDLIETECLLSEQLLDRNACAAKNVPPKKCSSSVWDRPWLENGREITVKCLENESNRLKRDMLAGGVQKTDVNDPEIINLAHASMQHYEKLTSAPNAHKIVQINSASTQVVAGSLTRIQFDLIETECLLSEQLLDRNACAAKNVPPKKCSSSIWDRPWLENGREITVNCSENKSKWSRRNQLPGSQQNLNLNDPEILSLAKESLQHYEKLSSTENSHTLGKVLSATTQVVAGTFKRITFEAAQTQCVNNEINSDCKLKMPLKKVCSASIWYRPWLKNGKEIKVECKEISNRKKRSFGSKKEVDVNDPKIIALTKESLHHYEQLSNVENKHEVVKVISATKKVVSGTLTTITFDISETSCPRNQITPNHKECSLKGPVKRCTTEIWDRPWLQNGKDIKVNCTPGTVSHEVQKRAIKDRVSSRKKRSFGSKKEVDVNDPKIIALTKESLHHYEQLSNVENKHEVVKVISATKKVVSGTLTTITFDISETSCPKNQITPNDKECTLKGAVKRCTTEIWDRPWLQNGKEIKVNCPSSHEVRKRAVVKRKASLLGSDEHIEDHQNPKFTQLAEEALLHADHFTVTKNDGKNFKRKLISVDKASTKMVNGKITNLNITVGKMMCDKTDLMKENCFLLIGADFVKCHLQIWERNWTNNKKHITLKCDDPKENFSDSAIKDTDKNAAQLADKVLRHIEAKYPNIYKLKIVKTLSHEVKTLEKLPKLYKLLLEVGITDCFAYSIKKDCKIAKSQKEKIYCKSSVVLENNLDEVASVTVACVMGNVTFMEDSSVRDIAREVQAQRLFQHFLLENPRTYSYRDENLRRLTIFKENLNKIVELNLKEAGTARYGVTKFADLTYDEFAKRHLGLRPDLNKNSKPRQQAQIPKDVELPSAFDWRDKGAVTPVKDQGQCGSCWAFSVTGNVEGQWKIQKGELISLSEQELVDCDKLDEGCNGGLPDNAYRAIEQLGGLETEQDYPYEAEDEKCHFNKSISRVQIRGAVNITTNETDMQKWLIKNGPISIGINANAMQFYVGGVSHPWKFLCSPKNLDHGVLIVGYGIKNYPLFHKTLPFWTIKNSWGDSWGEQGYYRVYRGDGTCGVNQMASSALV